MLLLGLMSSDVRLTHHWSGTNYNSKKFLKLAVISSHAVFDNTSLEGKFLSAEQNLVCVYICMDLYPNVNTL